MNNLGANQPQLTHDVSSPGLSHQSSGLGPGTRQLMSSGHNSVPKQRLKSATMNKRIQRGYSKDPDEYDDQN